MYINHILDPYLISDFTKGIHTNDVSELVRIDLISIRFSKYNLILNTKIFSVNEELVTPKEKIEIEKLTRTIIEDSLLHSFVMYFDTSAGCREEMLSDFKIRLYTSIDDHSLTTSIDINSLNLHTFFDECINLIIKDVSSRLELSDTPLKGLTHMYSLSTTDRLNVYLMYSSVRGIVRVMRFKPK